MNGKIVAGGNYRQYQSQKCLFVEVNPEIRLYAAYKKTLALPNYV